MKLTIKQKVKLACDIVGISMTELGEKMGMSQSATSQRLKTGKFSIDEYKKMSEILGCELIFDFRFNNNSSVKKELILKEKVMIACDIAGISMTELGKRMGMKQQTFSSRLKVGKFSIEEYEKMAEILGCEFVFEFKFTDISI